MHTRYIKVKKTYTSHGEEKTIWNEVGRMVEFDDGSPFIELHMFPGLKFFVFEKTPKDDTTLL